MLNESFAFVAVKRLLVFGEGDQDASMAGSKYVSLAKCMAVTLSSLNGFPNDPADRDIRPT